MSFKDLDKRLLYLTALACVAASIVSACPVSAADSAAAPKAGKVVMVILPAVSLGDLDSTDLPTIRGLMRTSAVGLMNTRTAGRLDAEKSGFMDPRYTPESGYAVLGAGMRVTMGISARKAYNRGEKVQGTTAAAVAERRMLVDTGDSEVVHTETARLRYDNSDLNYGVTIGLLGMSLHAASLKTAVIGNADDRGSAHREAVTVCMDDNGLVDYGNVGPTMTRLDPNTPYVLTTNSERLLREASRCIRQADFVVIELGDTSRLDRVRLDLTDEVFGRQRTDTLRRSDKLLGDLLSLIDLRRTGLIVLSPYPPSHVLERTDNSLCPVIAAGPGLGRGLLTSASTRRPGVLANTDIAPSVLSWLGVPEQPALVGRSMSLMPHESAPERLLELDRRATERTASQPMLRQLMVSVIVLVIAVTVLWFVLPPDHAARRRVLPVAVLLPPVVAPAMMLSALVPSGSPAGAWALVLLTSAALVAVCLGVTRRPIRALALISLLFTALALADLTTGAKLCGSSIMGYSLVEGSRYYGIGNEFMGAVIGASLVGIGLLSDWARLGQRAMRMLLISGLVVMAGVVGAPSLGANTGGLIAAVTAFGFAFTISCRKSLSAKRVIAITLGVTVALAVFAILDSLRGEQHQSHLGKTMALLLSGDFGDTLLIAKRKLAMNLLLIRVSIWSRLLVAYVLSAIVAAKANGAGRSVPFHLRVALIGVVSGTAAALVFNDSGVVAAATCFVYAWALLFLLAAGEEKDHT